MACGPRVSAAPIRRLLSDGLLALVLILSSVVCSAQSTQPSQSILTEADAIKTSDHSRFLTLLSTLDNRELQQSEKEFLDYLRAWDFVYNSDYDQAIPKLIELADRATDVTVRFRAGITAVNALVLARQYREAFSRLRDLLAKLPQIQDPDARRQALSVAAYLYNEVGEHTLGIKYAEQLIEENWQGRGACSGGQLKLEALTKSGRLAVSDPALHRTINLCESLGETLYANSIRAYAARLLINAARYDEAIALLNAHHEQVRNTRYPRLIADFDAALGEAYWRVGNNAMARRHALAAVNNTANNRFSEPIVNANRLLYELAKAEGDIQSALVFHERFAEADKGYLDDISARQIAYEKVTHELLANQMQIDALNKRNEILSLERENNRLYIALLISILAFIGLWAYKTKRLQMHFMRLSQKDGLTGIANRPHFLERAAQLLESNRKTGQELCIVLCDLDYFKAINDRFGHAAGDYVLKRTVEACQNYMRPEDLFGRFGGEEFGIVLAGCELAVARERCEQLRAAVESITAAEFGMHSNVTASFGVASARASGYDLRLLLAHADSALYQAKRQGRNCVVVYDRNSGSMPFSESGSARVDVA